jgi:hypothetical protein
MLKLPIWTGLPEDEIVSYVGWIMGDEATHNPGEIAEKFAAEWFAVVKTVWVEYCDPYPHYPEICGVVEDSPCSGEGACQERSVDTDAVKSPEGISYVCHTFQTSNDYPCRDCGGADHVVIAICYSHKDYFASYGVHFCEDTQAMRASCYAS